MSSLPTRTTHCFRCQRTPSSDDPPLQRCGGYRARHYCSKACQKNDWSYHKKECRALAADEPVPERIRTTYRVDLAGLGAGLNGTNSDSQNDKDDGSRIYHLKTTLSHLNDITLSGPYLSPEDMGAQMMHRCLEVKAVDELPPFEEMLHINHFSVPLEDGNVIKFEIIREENEVVKQSLPGPAYVVFSARPTAGPWDKEEVSHAPVDDMQVHGTFLEKEKAEERLRAVSEAFGQELHGEVEIRRDERGMNGLVRTRRREGGGRVVSIKFDDGILDYGGKVKYNEW